MVAKVFLEGELVGVVMNTTMLMKTTVDLELLRDTAVVEQGEARYRIVGWGPTYETADARIVERLKLEPDGRS